MTVDNEEGDDRKPSKPAKKSPGRPRKERSFGVAQLIYIVKKFVIQNLKKVRVDGYNSDRNRMDTIRTRIIRIVKKIPDCLLKECHAKGDYKSDSVEKYSAVYQKTCNQLQQILD